MSLIEIDPRIRELNDALTSRNGTTPDDTPDPTDRVEAAVSMVVRIGDQLDFLLIKRASSDRDPWSGQMALPGGRWDPTDSSLLETAIRETREETGVDLRESGVTLGRLDDVRPASKRLPKMRIAPFVFAVPHGTEAAVASSELQSVHWVSLDSLRSPTVQASIAIDVGGTARTFPSYALVGEHVWGLTHRILTDFLSLSSPAPGTRRPG
jgi:8-oxo-dGTP pyrophosphatase MutT (NUDIX family)